MYSGKVIENSSCARITSRVTVNFIYFWAGFLLIFQKVLCSATCFGIGSINHSALILWLKPVNIYVIPF